MPVHHQVDFARDTCYRPNPSDRQQCARRQTARELAVFLPSVDPAVLRNDPVTEHLEPRSHCAPGSFLAVVLQGQTLGGVADVGIENAVDARQRVFDHGRTWRSPCGGARGGSELIASIAIEQRQRYSEADHRLGQAQVLATLDADAHSDIGSTSCPLEIEQRLAPGNLRLRRAQRWRGIYPPIELCPAR